jgi:hypothetical protein
MGHLRSPHRHTGMTRRITESYLTSGEHRPTEICCPLPHSMRMAEVSSQSSISEISSHSKINHLPEDQSQRYAQDTNVAWELNRTHLSFQVIREDGAVRKGYRRELHDLSDSLFSHLLDLCKVTAAAS